MFAIFFGEGRPVILRHLYDAEPFQGAEKWPWNVHPRMDRWAWRIDGSSEHDEVHCRHRTPRKAFDDRTIAAWSTHDR